MRSIQQRVPAWVMTAGVCLALVGSAVAPAAPVSAQSFVYDIGVDFPEYIILWYWDQIMIDITTAQLTSYLFGQAAVDAGTQSPVASFAGPWMTVDGGIDSVVDDGLINDPGDPLWLGIANAWAMQSVSASGSTQVSIRIKKKKKDAKLPGDGGNKITAKAVQVGAAGVIGKQIAVPSTGSGVYLWGAIYLQIDITGAQRAGDYTGIEVEIKAENI